MAQTELFENQCTFNDVWFYSIGAKSPNLGAALVSKSLGAMVEGATVTKRYHSVSDWQVVSLRLLQRCVFGEGPS